MEDTRCKDCEAFSARSTGKREGGGKSRAHMRSACVIQPEPERAGVSQERKEVKK